MHTFLHTISFVCSFGDSEVVSHASATTSEKRPPGMVLCAAGKLKFAGKMGGSATKVNEAAFLKQQNVRRNVNFSVFCIDASLLAQGTPNLHQSIATAPSTYQTCISLISSHIPRPTDPSPRSDPTPSARIHSFPFPSNHSERVALLSRACRPGSPLVHFRLHLFGT